LSEERSINVVLYLEPPIRPRPVLYLDPREVHGSNIGGSTLREDIVGLELEYGGVPGVVDFLMRKKAAPEGTRMFTPSVHFRTDGAEWRRCLSSKLDITASGSPLDYQKRNQWSRV